MFSPTSLHISFNLSNSKNPLSLGYNNAKTSLKLSSDLISDNLTVIRSRNSSKSIFPSYLFVYAISTKLFNNYSSAAKPNDAITVFNSLGSISPPL